MLVFLLGAGLMCVGIAGILLVGRVKKLEDRINVGTKRILELIDRCDKLEEIVELEQHDIMRGK